MKSRREFLSKSLIGLASIGFVDFSSKIKLPDLNKKIIQDKSKNIIYRTLGKTKLKLPIVSMGVMNADVPELVKQSYEIGIRYFDTAASYQNGRNEEMVGKVIKELGVRNKVIIGTKVFLRKQEKMTAEQKKEKFLEIFDGCIKRLQMDYVDILYSHGVSTAEEVQNPGILEAITLLKKQKKIKFSGVSTHKGQAIVLDEVARTRFYDVVLAGINFTMADDKILLESIKKASEKGIGIIAMKTQAGGKHSNQTALLKWVLRNKYITTAIPGYTNFEHMNENFSVAYNLEYSEEEKAFLKDKKVDIGMAFCRECSNCMKTCPYGVDIPTLMRTHMYAAQYTNFYQARATLNDIPIESGLNNCKNCLECTAKCIRNVNVPKRIDELKVIYC